MPTYQRFGAQADWPAVGTRLMLVPGVPPGWGHAGPTFGQRVWHVVTLRAMRAFPIAGAGDTAVFYFGVGNIATTTDNAFNPQDFVDHTKTPLPAEAWYPTGDERDPSRPGGLVIEIGQAIYAIVTGGAVGHTYVFTGMAVEFDP